MPTKRIKEIRDMHDVYTHSNINCYICELLNMIDERDHKITNLEQAVVSEQDNAVELQQRHVHTKAAWNRLIEAARKMCTNMEGVAYISTETLKDLVATLNELDHDDNKCTCYPWFTFHAVNCTEYLNRKYK